MRLNKISLSKLFASAAILALLNVTFLYLPVQAAQQITGKLITSGNQAVLINGNQAAGGETILTGATIQTPDNVAATIELGPLGLVELSPGSIVVLNFTDNQLNVTVKKGCTVVTANPGTKSRLTNDQGQLLKTNAGSSEGVAGNSDLRSVQDTAAESDGTNKKKFNVCNAVFLPGTSSAGAAGAAGATATGVGTGLSTTSIALITGGIVGGIATTSIIVSRGDNPSPGAP